MNYISTFLFLNSIIYRCGFVKKVTGAFLASETMKELTELKLFKLSCPLLITLRVQGHRCESSMCLSLTVNTVRVSLNCIKRFFKFSFSFGINSYCIYPQSRYSVPRYKIGKNKILSNYKK